jgi:hypothetical protein
LEPIRLRGLIGGSLEPKLSSTMTERLPRVIW